MRNLFFLSLLFLCAGFFSCQKEITGIVTPTDSTGGGGTTPGSTNGELLIKVYGKSPAPSLDSNVSYYTYNSFKKVTSRHYILFAYSCSNDTWDWYERDAAGLIVRSKQYIQASCNPSSTDTVVTIHHYGTGTTPMLLSSVQSQDLLGIIISDSTVYTYNSSGKATKMEQYQANSLIPSTLLTSRSVFAYDAAGNVTKVEQYAMAGTVATLVGTQTFEWDSKTETSGYTEAESLIISAMPVPKHNPTKVSFTSSTVNSVNSYTYTYNSANKPSTSVSKAVNRGFPDVTTNFNFYYQ